MVFFYNMKSDKNDFGYFFSIHKSNVCVKVAKKMLIFFNQFKMIKF